MDRRFWRAVSKAFQAIGGSRHTQRKQPRRTPATRRVALEPLEDRRLLAVITVDSLADGAVNLTDGNTTLRDALALAADAAYPDADEIVFDSSLGLDTTPGEIELTEGQLVIDSDVTITGPGAEQLAIDADADDDGTGESRLFYVSSGVTATLDGLTLRHGYVDGSDGDTGGAIQSDQATLKVEDCILENNTVTTEYGRGGAIYAYSSSLEVVDSIIRSSSATGTYSDGGGIYTRSGTLTLGDCRITQNSVSGGWSDGGGVAGYFTDISISGCTISENHGTTGGGVASSVGNLSIRDSIISDNSGKYGGGIDASGSAAVFELENVVVSGNQANDGGGLRLSGESAKISSCLITGNISSGGGGGITSDADLLTVTNSTIAGNSASGAGAGIWADDDGVVKIANSIVALNRGGDIGGTDIEFVASNNLVGVDPHFVRSPSPGADGVWATEDDDPGDLRLTNTSAAIDAGDNTLALDVDGSPFTEDFDGNTRFVNGTVDLGAYEYQATGATGRETPSTVVTTAEDDFDVFDGDISLREAIWYVNENMTAGNVVTFDSGLDGATILLGGYELSVYTSMTIDATALASLEINANTDGDSSTYESRALGVINCGTGVDVTLAGVSISGGAAYAGGGVFVQNATLTVTDSIISDNLAFGGTAGGGGGAIYAEVGDIYIVDSVVTGNHGVYGGGVRVGDFSGRSSLSVTRSTITNNSTDYHGGAIYSAWCPTIVSDSVVSGNSADDAGGGIYARISALSLINSRVVANSSGTYGGGIYISSRSLTITNSEVTANNAGTKGGGIYTAENTAVITNSTIAANSATSGGGVAVFHDVFRGYPVFNNTIVASNEGGDFRAHFASPHTDDTFEGSNNLVSTTALPIDPLFVDLQTYADIAGTDGQLNTADDGPLGDYRLLDGSPAINTGSNLYLDETDSDGTGPDLEIDLNASGTIGDYTIDSDLAGQPRVIGSAVDIGAYESQNTTELDFGDAPAPYATTLLANGARHVAAGPMLGSVRDGEADGVPSTAADADDTTGTTDDEDGVIFGTIQVGQLGATVTVNVQYAPSGAKLDAWIDFNGDGCWGGPFEQIADNVSVVEGDNTITFDVPSWALSGETYARFRLSTSGDLAPSGTASDGEVEDYRLAVTPPGKGSGTFAPCEPLATSQLGAEAVFAADMDGDGDTDVLAAFLDGTIAWYENAGNLDFRVHTIPSSVDEPVSVHAADLDGDGDMDVLSASSGDDTIAWYENDGNGNFSTHTITTAADGARSVFAADIDGDGVMDVLSASANDDTIAWYRNDGDENFTAHTITTAADGAWSVHAVDLDADGDVDVLSASWNDDTIAWYENDGSGNFTIHTITSSADRATSVFVADVNGDGHLDVLSGAYSQITWYQNDGNQVFAAHEIPHSATGVRCVYAADVDSDGDTDVLSASDAGEMLWWYENDGSEVFTPRYVFDTTERARAILAADVDGDGDTDILATLSGGSRVWGEGKVNCYKNNGTQGFTPYDIATPAPSVLSVFAADMDGDGDMDALSASLRNDRITWYENDGQDFTAHTVTRSANGAACVVAVDVDGDGDMDVLSASRSDDTIAWYENDGQEEFSPHVITTSASADWPGSLLAADVDGDGDMDVLAANYYEDNVAWYENQGAEGFATHVIITGMDAAISVYAADVDGDGDMDVLSASNGDDTVAWYENNGSQGFTAHTISASADGTQSVCAADLDGDGDLDVVSNNFDEILWYENDGAGSFVTRSIPSGGDSVGNLVAADMDGDGDMDLLATFVSRDTLSWYENQGNASFTRHDITTTADGAISVFAADMDGDGDLDAILASSYDNTVAWYENLSPGFTVAESGSSTTVSESGVSDTFTVALDVAPASNVVISVNSNAPGEVALAPATLTFTPENWNTPQTVTVSAVDDSIVDGTRTTTVTLSIVDAQSDDAFDSLPDKTLSVTSIDNDVAGFTVTETENDTTVSETGAGDTFDVVLNAAPLSDVSLTITILDTDEVTTDKTTLLFTPENWNTPQTITLSGVNDYRIDGDQVTTITISIDRAASDDAFDALADQTVTVTTTDDNVAGFSVSHTDGDTTVSEDGTTDTFSVVLDVAPSSNVVILVTSSDLGEVTVATTSLTFTPDDWNIPQSVTVTGADDPIADGSQTTGITFSIDDPNSDNDFDALDDQSLVVTTTDNESAGFTVTESDNSTTVSESGATDTFAVALTIAPLSNVVLLVTSDDPGEATVDQTSLTFTPSNWHIPQTVTVTGMDDFLLDGLQTTTITLAVDTVSSHDAFDNAKSQTVLVATEDNDFATLTVLHTDDATIVDESGTSDTFTVVLDAEPTSDVVLLVTSGDPDEAGTDVTSLTFTPSDWNEPQTVTVTGVDDVFVDGSQASVIVLSVDAANSDDAFDFLADTPVPVTTTDDDVAGYVIEQSQDSTRVSEFSTTDTFTVALTAAPLSNVVITVTSGDTGEATIDKTELTFTPSNWNEPQIVTVTGIDDTVIDGDQTTTITLAIDGPASDDAFDSLANQTVLVTTTDNDDVGLIVTEPAGGLSVTEGGTTAQFTVALDTQPGVNVVVLVTSGDKSEAIVTKASLTFTPDNWDVAQAVTVMGKDDLVMDGDQTTTITLTIDDAHSDDAFDDVPDTAVLVTTTDNDSAGVLIDASELTTTESGGTATFTIVLRTEPAADVTVAFSSSDLTEGDVTSLPLTFTAGNWYTPQTVTITGLDDHLLDGNVAYTITAAFSSNDPGYDDYQIDDLAVTNVDDDVPGITVTPTTGLTTSESGDSASFTVVLKSEPTADVVITVTGDATEGELSSTKLTFSPGNWDEPQGVTITGIDDHVADGNITYTLLTDVSSDDSDYNDYQLPALTVTNVDDDEPGITVTPTTGLTTSESGDSASFTVVLQSEPTADVTITVTGDATEGELSSTELTFSPGNWNEPQGFTITGVDDHVADGNVTYTLLTDVSSGDSDYNDYQLPTLTVTNVDDDEPGITVTPTTGLTTSESGDSASFTVVLKSEPTADVTITVTGDATEGDVSPATLTFSPGNWNEPQGFTITGVDDHVADGNITYTLLTDVSSGDSDYNDYQLPALTVTNVDDDEPGITVTPTTGLTTSESGDSASFTVVLQSEPTADVTITVTGDATEGDVSPATLTFSPGNWNEPQGFTITGVDDHVADGNITYTLLTDVSSGDSDYNDYQLPALTVTNVDDDEPGITVTPTTGLTTSESGDSASFTVVLQSEPTADVTITVTGDATEGELSSAQLTFSPGNWNQPQGLTITGVDDHVADGNITYTLLTDVSSGDSDYNDYQLPALTVTNVDDDQPGITVTPTTGLTTSESGDSASFTVVLKSEPTADVVITVTGDATEGELSSTKLTFSPGNWNEPQGFTITGVDDHVADGNITYTLLTDVSSGDSDYNDYQLPALTVTNVDDDQPGITVTPTTGLTTSESGDSASFTVVLQSEPTADVTITVTGDATEGELSSTKLTFSPGNWDDPQNFTITGVDDHVADGNVTYTLLTDVSSGDSDYNDYQLPALTVTNVDDDQPGITVTPTTGLTTSESGDSASFTVVLQSEPTADVTITVTSDATEGELSPAKLTFSPGNWDEPQGFTITGVDDHVADGNITYTLLTDVSSGDSDYNDYQLPALTVTNVDDDQPGITVTPTTGLTTSENGDTASFTVVLQSRPTGDVTIPISTSNETEATALPVTLTFTPENWDTPQAVTVTGVDDEIDDGDVSCFVVLGSAVSDDANYNGLDAPDVQVTNEDNDEGFVPEDLGQVDFRRLESLAPAGEELWFQLETTHDGWLTVVADGEWTADELSFALYDPDDLATPLAVADTSQAVPRFDYAAGQGDVLLLQVTGTGSDATLLVANLVHEAGTAITVFGTADVDVLTFDAAASREITINNVVYHYEDSELTTVDFDGGEGYDTVWLYDSTGNESLEAWPDHASFINASGDDVADFAVQVSGIEELLGYATQGGTDAAVFHGSENADKFKSYEDSVRLRAGNSSYNLRAKRFDTVVGDAGSGGKNMAVFNGSDGDDTFQFRGSENAAQMEGTGRDHTATGFGSIVVRAGDGENDVAYLTDFPGPDSGVDDVVYFKSHKTQLIGAEVEVTVRAFDVIHATASESGFDVARIYDTSGDDHLEVDGDTARLYRRSGTELDLLYEAIGFERVKAYSTAGDDTTDIGEHDFDLLLNGWAE